MSNVIIRILDSTFALSLQYAPMIRQCHFIKSLSRFEMIGTVDMCRRRVEYSLVSLRNTPNLLFDGFFGYLEF